MKKIAILGFGVVGSGVAEVLTQNKRTIEAKLGEPIEIKYILDLRNFPDSPFSSKIIHDFNIILSDPEISIVAEMMGGSHPAYDFSKSCLLAGKNVVTSNKEVVAKFGSELLTLAKQNGVRYLFEASVGGGIPIIRPMLNDLVSNEITSIDGILNGTTNYILTQMSEFGTDFETALKDAQIKGYAEADPSADIDGLDAARKIVILAALSFGKCLPAEEISVEGIRNVSTDDFEIAKKLGYTIKLIAHSEKINEKILANVSPRFVSLSDPLAHISDVYNGILVDTNMLGKVMFYGQGAGKLPTASAVVADIMDVAGHTESRNSYVSWDNISVADAAPISDYICGYCIIMSKGIYETMDESIAAIKNIGDKTVIITKKITAAKYDELLSALGDAPLSSYRTL